MGRNWGAQEWCDTLFLRYVLDPQDLPTHCDGCQAKFSISHALDYKKGSLITARHNELCDGVAYLAGKAFTPSHVRDDPLIYSGRAVKRTKATSAGADGKTNHTGVQPPEVTEQKGDLLIRDLWEQGTDSVHGMRVVNTNTTTHKTKDPARCLHESKRGKNRMYLEACLQKRRHFSPFVRLGGWTAGGGGDGNPEKVSQSPGHQVEAILI